MDKKEFKKAEIEAIRLEKQDVIATSGLVEGYEEIYEEDEA